MLSAIRVPTLRYMAERAPGAKVVELPGADHILWVGDQDALLDEIEEFLTGVRPHAAVDRVLAPVLFTDIDGSTTLAAERGDRRWRDLLQSYYTLARREVWDSLRGPGDARAQGRGKRKGLVWIVEATPWLPVPTGLLTVTDAPNAQRDSNPFPVATTFSQHGLLKSATQLKHAIRPLAL